MVLYFILREYESSNLKIEMVDKKCPVEQVRWFV